MTQGLLSRLVPTHKAAISKIYIMTADCDDVAV